MRKTASGLLAGVAVLAIGIGPVAAANPHFLYAYGNESGGTLTVDFKIAGLGNSELDTITLSGHVTADWRCVNKGAKGQEPPGLIRTDEDVTVSGEYRSDRNGSITATIEADPTPPLCPRGMKEAILDSATWTNAMLEDSYGAEITVD